jgi:tetratricopeptide (TPR) repeat protein
MAGTEGEGIRVPVQPVLSKETAALLEHMIGFYGRLAQAGAGDVELRQKVANANRRVGDIRQRLGQFEQAEGAYGQALELYQELKQERPDDTTSVREVARIHNEIGNLQQARGRPAEAHASYRKSLETLAVVPLEPSTPAQNRFEWARTYYFLGKRPGRESGPGPPGPPAGPERPGDDRPGPPPPPPRAKEGRPDPDSGPPESEPDREPRDVNLGRAIAILEPLVAQYPAVSSHRVWQAVIQESLANLLAERDELTEARSLLEAAVATLNDCRAREGKSAYQHLLSRNHENLADVLDRLGERELAEAAWRQAREPVSREGLPTSPK